MAVAGATALVNAMVPDGWNGVRKRSFRLLGRGDEKETEAVAAWLELSQGMLSGLSGTKLEKAQAEQAIVWRARLGDLLERHPDAEDELGRLVAEVQAQVAGSADWVEQHAAALDQAQQAVQGHGVQNVTFGGQSASDASYR